jgi:hypothetical protein
MAFTNKKMVDGQPAEAAKVNINFEEIYAELENFPGENGALQADAVTVDKIPDGTIPFSRFSKDAYLTSKSSYSNASDDTLVTSKAVKTYWRSLL